MSKKKHGERIENEETVARQGAEETPETAEAATEAMPEAEAAQEPAKEADEGVTAEALAAALARQEEYLGMAQRVQADFENFRRRNQNVRKEAYDEGARAFATTLLPVLDNLERAVAAAENTSDASLKEGVEMVCRQFSDAFAKRGIEPIDRLGQPFDPNLENAVMQGAPEEGEPGTVCRVLQKGYQMEGTVLRHAMVVVVPE